MSEKSKTVKALHGEVTVKALHEEVPDTKKSAFINIWEARREHITDGTPCWCGPQLDSVDPDTGVEVWIHRRAQ